jgi:hypothetical protein
MLEDLIYILRPVLIFGSWAEKGFVIRCALAEAVPNQV